ncbi:MAG: hypothetical protein AABZ60_22235 [Planctomycetota bacterium]
MKSQGFTYLELMVTLTILVIAILGLLVVMNTLQLMNKTTKEMLLTSMALNEKVEFLKSLSVAAARQAIQDTIDGTASANAIQLTTLLGGGLNPITNQPLFSYRYFAKENAVPVGEINMNLFPAAGPITPITIQAEIDANISIPKYSFDMNVDGDFDDDATTNTGTAATYKFLPIQVRIRWRSFYGQLEPVSRENFREFVINTMLSESALE